MELALSPEDAAFRDEVRAFIAENYPKEMRVSNPETDLTKEQSLLWHRILYKKGWIAPLWPKEYGGPGWSITRRFIFEQETSRAGTLCSISGGRVLRSFAGMASTATFSGPPMASKVFLGTITWAGPAGVIQRTPGNAFHVSTLVRRLSERRRSGEAA